MPEATALCEGADALLVIGTSLQVYPANLLVYEVPYACPILVIDPDAPPIESSKHQIQYFRTTASEGMKQVKDYLIQLNGAKQANA
jgi:NAD-dependent deacetylase